MNYGLIMQITESNAKRVLSRYRTRDAMANAIEDRIIRCKTMRAESRLLDVLEACWSISTERGSY